MYGPGVHVTDEIELITHDSPTEKGLQREQTGSDELSWERQGIAL